MVGGGDGMKCECPISGFCERHQVNKTDHLHDLCQNRPGYFELWESGKGPLQSKAERSRPRTKQRTTGPGRHLKLILADKGYKVKSSGCNCNDKAAKMDAWGVERCRERIDEIADWLEESARKAGWLERLAVTMPVIKGLARKQIIDLINEAIDRAESSAKTNS